MSDGDYFRPGYADADVLTLRDRFAMAALIGLLAAGDRSGAYDAYDWADFMLDAREEG